MLALRKLSPGGYAYLTGSVACADRDLEPGETLADYYQVHGYLPGQWYGSGADELGVSGRVTAEQMISMFGEGRHPNAAEIEAQAITDGATAEEAMRETKLGRALPKYSGVDDLRSKVGEAYREHNRSHGRPVGAPISETTRSQIRRGVQREAFAEAHQGRTPSETELTAWLAQQKAQFKSAVSGYELVIAPPKSVSVAWALSTDTDRETITGLHRQAVRDTLDYIENNCAFTRRGDNGEAQVDVRGITAALFEHWDSRAGDPHLHTHVVISNKVQRDSDGKWCSLDGRTIHAAAVTMSEFYNSRIRDLFRDHGASWSERPRNGIDAKNPVWELDAVPNEYLEGFSRRATQVEQYRASGIVRFRRDYGREPDPKELLEIGRRAQYGSRAAKQAPTTLAEHLSRWRAQARQMGPEQLRIDLQHRLFRSPETLSEVDVPTMAEATRERVSDYYSHFNRWNLEAEAHRQTAHLCLPSGQRSTLISQIVDTIIRAPDTISLQAPSLVPDPPALRRASGQSVFVAHNAERYTTDRTLREEAALAKWGSRTDGQRVLADVVAEQLAANRKLNDGQRHAVAEFATSGRRIQMLSAPAGTGKTTTMKVFADTWRAAGGRVHAFGPSARAAIEIATAIGEKHHTLHQLSTAIAAGVAPTYYRYRPGDVLVIDEAGMAGTHTLHAVVDYALRCGADVRLVGDDKQLPAIEAGGALRWFRHHNGEVRLTEVVRFKDPNQARASLQLHAGDPNGLKYYFQQGWVSGGSREMMRAEAYRNWQADLDAGRDTFLIVPANVDVIALNEQARLVRLARGEVGSRGPSAALHDGTYASKGDWVVTRCNDRKTTYFMGRDWVRNGSTWDVVKIYPTGEMKLRNRTSRGTVTLGADYVATHVELAYAATIHRSQGMTVKGDSHALATQGISREQVYTMLTRATGQNCAYVETHQHTIDSHHETPEEKTREQVLTAALGRSSAETPASEELLRSLTHKTSLAELVGRHQYIAHTSIEDRLNQALSTYAPTALEAPSAPRLERILRAAHDLGWSPEPLLAQITQNRDVTRADDPAALLRWHITQRLHQGTPPPSTRAPLADDVRRWREIVRQHAPAATVEDTDWNAVWRRAATASADGLNPDVAVIHAARALAIRPINDPTRDHEFAADAVTTVLDQFRADGAGMRPILPWMSRPDISALSSDLLEHLHEVHYHIHGRLQQLREHVISEAPAWTAGLGPRPDTPELAATWDDVAVRAAAYRDTYGITTTDPAVPLGHDPGEPGLRHQAWTELLARWHPPSPDPSAVAEQPTNDRSLDVDWETSARATPSLHEVMQQHRALSDELLEHSAITAVRTHAPQALEETPGAHALVNLLRRSERQGWQADRLVHRAVGKLNLDTADDPAGLLAWHIRNHITDRPPPARVADPSPEQLHRWQAMVTRTVSDADATAPEWRLVWRHAAGGDADGLNPDLAVTTAAESLAQRPAADPMPPHRFVAHVLNDVLDAQRDTGQGRQPVLPWMPDPIPSVQAIDPDRAAQFYDLAEHAQARLHQLREQILTNPPNWVSGLGRRPDAPDAVTDWERCVVLAAAYRETYRVTSDDPQLPLGPEPSESEPERAQAWRTLTEASPVQGPAPQVDQHPPVDHDLTSTESLDFELEPVSRTTPSLHALLQQHRALTDELLERSAINSVRTHAPHLLEETDSSHALIDLLRRAEREGWQADRLVHRATGSRNLDTANDPAGLLARHIRNHITDRPPPARVADPSTEQLHRWQALVTRTVADAEVTASAWTIVWRHAAGGAAEGLNADLAITTAAELLSQRPADDLRDAHRFVAADVADTFAAQRQSGHGYQPVLPWMSDPIPSVQAIEPDSTIQFHDIAEHARTRLDQIRDTVIYDPPNWAAGLGPRPQTPDAAAAWERQLSLAAAYRETYGITGDDPQLPLGVRPADTDQARAQAWNSITENWHTAPAHTTRQVDDELAALHDRLTHSESHDENASEPMGTTRTKHRERQADPTDDEKPDARNTFGTSY